MFAQELTILLLPKVEYYDIVNYKTGKLLMGKARTLTKSGQIQMPYFFKIEVRFKKKFHHKIGLF